MPCTPSRRSEKRRQTRIDLEHVINERIDFFEHLRDLLDVLGRIQQSLGVDLGQAVYADVGKLFFRAR